MQENKISGKLMSWMIMSMEKCLPGGKNGRIEYLEEKIWEINVVQPLKSHWNHAQIVTILDKKTRLLDAIQYIILNTD